MLGWQRCSTLRRRRGRESTSYAAYVSKGPRTISALLWPTIKRCGKPQGNSETEFGTLASALLRFEGKKRSSASARIADNAVIIDPTEE